jgi:hypothetical protein
MGWRWSGPWQQRRGLCLARTTCRALRLLQGEPVEPIAWRMGGLRLRFQGTPQGLRRFKRSSKRWLPWRQR